ncbi:LacI family DNA-binding transcriptional regulator [Brevibacillus sp. NRS-1366]|uniref:LacI family DNA-binding transcriptional regulator n=1 Tax=Brevibacillus sp. NRS-1366 TaxID=3233899 RepID=UPI003D24FD7D
MATIKEISRIANVSQATVSRVLSRDKTFSVSADTRKKILAVAAELGYKSTRERKNRFYVAVSFMPSIFQNQVDHDFHLSIRSGIEKIASANNTELINVFSTSGETAKSYKGAIIIGNYKASEIDAMVEYLNTDNVVIVGLCHDDNRFDSIWFDARKAVYLGLGHLVQNGHRDIGYIGAVENPEKPEEELRVTFFRTFMQKRLGNHSPMIFMGENGPQNGYKIMKEILANNKLPSAFFIANDPLAIGALKALNEAGVKVPDELSIVSFDGHSFTDMTSPPLTTIAIPTEYMGELAMQTLLDNMERKKGCIKILVPAALIVRKSCKDIHKEP